MMMRAAMAVGVEGLFLETHDDPANAFSDGPNVVPVEELAAVKGLTAKLAEGIVKKRPFASLDDLRRVKGLGARILDKVRSSLKL